MYLTMYSFHIFSTSINLWMQQIDITVEQTINITRNQVTYEMDALTMSHLQVNHLIPVMMETQTMAMAVRPHERKRIITFELKIQLESQYAFQAEVMESLNQQSQNNEMTITQTLVMDVVIAVKLRVLTIAQLLKVNYQYAHLYEEMELCLHQRSEMMEIKMMVLDENQTAQVLLMATIELVEIIQIQHHDNQCVGITL